MTTEKRYNPWVVLVVLCTGFFMILLDTTVVQIAIPSIIDSLHASLDQILWVINAYILVYAVLLITAGRLGDVMGPRTLFVIGLVIFTAASAYCGLAPDTMHLITARVIQGVGGALLTPQTLSMLTIIFPPERRGAAFGIWGGISGIAAVIGPTLGGYLVTNFSWRAIFYINVPVGIAAVVATFLLVPDVRMDHQHTFDIGGVALASVGLFAIVFGLVDGQRFNWGAVVGPISIPLIIGLGVALLGAFVAWEARQAEPLMPLSLFQNRNFSVMNWVGVTTSFGMLGLFLPIIIYFQSVLGMTALQAGLAVAPMSVVLMVVAPLSGRLSDAIGGKYILFLGCLIFGGGMGAIAFTSTTSATVWTFLPWFILAGVGLGMVFAPMATIAMRDISATMAGAASGIFNTTRQLGSLIGTAVVGAVLQNQLVTQLAAHAAAASTKLPPAYRQRFVQAFAQASQGGLQVGPGQSGAAALPAGIPPAIAKQLQVIVHSVFTNAYVDTLRPTLAIPISLMVLGAVSTLLVRRRPAATPTPEAPAPEPVFAG